jgi:hypothetical protein
MTLRKVEFLDRSGEYAYAPPKREAVINLDEILSVVPVAPENNRFSYALVDIRFRDGSTLQVIGKPSDFIEMTP